MLRQLENMMSSGAVIGSPKGDLERTHLFDELDIFGGDKWHEAWLDKPGDSMELHCLWRERDNVLIVCTEGRGATTIMV